MFTVLIAGVLSILAIPELSLKWSDPSHRAVDIVVSDENRNVNECLDLGLTVRYRVELQLCRDLSGWFSSCREVQTVVRTLERDPISENYRFIEDTLGDESDPEQTSYLLRDAAITRLRLIDQRSLQSLGGPRELQKGDQPLFLQVRLLADCKGEYNRTLARISYFLTLGLVRIHEENTGTIPFKLAVE